MSGSIMSAIGGTVPKAIIHIQIEKSGVLQFAAYDHFHMESIVFGGAVKPAVIESLLTQHVLRPYTAPPRHNAQG